MPGTQPILIRIKKATDGRTALSCTRADGTTTWQRQQGAQATFFPKHDLTHYAVETALGQREGFYGLVSAGWNFSDFGHPWPRGRLPAEAIISEMIVGMLDLERRIGERPSAQELNQKLAEYAAENSLPQQRELTEEDLARVRERRAEVFARWDAVLPGDALEIPFEVAQGILNEPQRQIRRSHGNRDTYGT
jgi:hypothetical protein